MTGCITISETRGKPARVAVVFATILGIDTKELGRYWSLLSRKSANPLYQCTITGVLL